MSERPDNPGVIDRQVNPRMAVTWLALVRFRNALGLLVGHVLFCQVFDLNTVAIGAGAMADAVPAAAD